MDASPRSRGGWIALIFLFVVSRDILYELASVGDLPLPQASPAPSNKRERDSDSPGSSGAISIASDSPRGNMLVESYRTFAGSRRVSKDHNGSTLKDGPSLAAATFAQPLPRPPSALPAAASAAASDAEKHAANADGSGGAASPSFALPVHTDELGRLPLHPGFNVSYAGGWQDQPQSQPQSQPQPSQVQAQQQQPVGSGGPAFDPRMMGMYALQPPSFNELFSASMQEPSAFTQAGPEVAMAGASSAGPAAGAGVGAQGQPLSSEEMAFTDNTLAMWSNAPTSFE